MRSLLQQNQKQNHHHPDKKEKQKHQKLMGVSYYNVFYVKVAFCHLDWTPKTSFELYNTIWTPFYYDRTPTRRTTDDNFYDDDVDLKLFFPSSVFIITFEFVAFLILFKGHLSMIFVCKLNFIIIKDQIYRQEQGLTKLLKSKSIASATKNFFIY